MNSRLKFECDVHKLVYHHNKHFGETIFSGFRAEIPEINDFFISSQMAGLRMFAYAFCSYEKKQYPAMEKADITHTASVVNCYGLRIFETESDSKLILLNNRPDKYSNCQAILSGVEAVNRQLTFPDM